VEKTKTIGTSAATTTLVVTHGANFDGVPTLIYESDKYVSIPTLEKATGQYYEDARNVAKNAWLEDALSS
jgi:hypothetical protein